MAGKPTGSRRPRGYPRLYRHVAGLEEGHQCCGDCSRALAIATGGRPSDRGSAGCGNTDSWVEAPRPGWSAQYGDAANSSYTTTAGARRSRWTGAGRSKASSAPPPRWAQSSYLAANGQTAGGCSLMVWENDNDGRQRWCTRMVLGGGFASPLFDGFDNLYVGQPGIDAVLPAHAVDPLAPARDRNAARPRGFSAVASCSSSPTSARCWCSTRTAAPSSAQLFDLVAGVDPTDSHPRSDRLPARPPRLPGGRRTRLLGGHADDRAGPLAARRTALPRSPRLRYHPGQTPLLTQRVDQRRGHRRRAGQPGAVRRRQHGLRQRSRPALWALDTSNGKPKWSVPLGFQPQTPPTVAPAA